MSESQQTAPYSEAHHLGQAAQGRAWHHPPAQVLRYTLYTAGACAILFFALLFLLQHYVRHVETMRPFLFVLIVMAMAVSGGLGGCLYNLRGISKHSANNDYSEHYNITYYLRPVEGAICGVIVFFLVLGGALSFTVANGNPLGGLFQPLGLLPYIAVALLAGYASTEFMAKMKDLAGSLFAVRRRE